MFSESAKLKVQRFGRFLSNMVMPNIGAFIAWGLITALFIPTGWLPNESLGKLVGPMITYLLPLLIGYTGGKLAGGDRGAVVGAITTMGVIVGTDIPMFLGAMIMGPLGGCVIKKFDDAIRDSIPGGFEMLVNNFSLGILGGILAMIAYAVVGPVVGGANDILRSGVEAIALMARAAAHDAYCFDAFKSNAGKARKHEWVFVCDKAEKKAAQAALDLSRAWAAGSAFTRDLVNTPPNVCVPAWLGEQAKAMAKDYAALTVKVLKKKEIEALGMGALLGVAQGSVNEPRFIIFEYRPENAVNAKPQVLVGKGVTFDTGGISIKPSGAMDEMKGDMGGAAAVFGAMKALCEAELPLYVVGLVASVENMPDGNAIRPGDILKTMSGKTVEVLNTDAEGRLILCDALTYATRYQPQAVIDMATLTGAIVVALGGVRSGLFSNDDALADALLRAGEAARDPAWRMPLDPEYREMLRSPFADIPNISGVRDAGAVTAAAYLSEFVDYPWAHLDIAGSAFKSSGPKGGTGRPVGLLLEYFRAQVA